MKTSYSLILLILCLGVTAVACGRTEPSSTPTITPEASSTYTPLPLPTVTLTLPPTPTSLVQPTFRPNPTQTPVDWKVLAHHYDSPGRFTIVLPTFISDHLISFLAYDGTSTKHFLEIDSQYRFSEPVLNGAILTSSPNQKYYLMCNASGLDLYRVSDQRLVAHQGPTLQGTVILNGCGIWTQWKADDAALVFESGPVQSPDGSKKINLYRWKTDGSLPDLLAQINWTGYAFSLSPDLTLMASLTGTARLNSGSALVEATVDILDFSNGKNTTLKLEATSFELYVNWLTNDVLTMSMGRYERRYYDIKTGKSLFDFNGSPNIGLYHQIPTASPNQRWVTLDQYPSKYATSPKRYSLYDLEIQNQEILSETPSAYLAFGAWKADSSQLYIVNAPAKIDEPMNSPLPAGLLAYDPLQKKATVLVPDVVRAYWSPDSHFAWVLHQGPPTGEVIASLLDMSDKSMKAELHVSNKPVQGDPARDPYLPYWIYWSPDSTRAILKNDLNELWLLTGSQATLLATDYNGSNSYIRWSPTGRYLLTSSGTQIWVVDTQEIK